MEFLTLILFKVEETWSKVFVYTFENYVRSSFGKLKINFYKQVEQWAKRK